MAVGRCCACLIPTSPLTPIAAYCRRQATVHTYCITSLQRKHATRPRSAAVSLVQHASCKLREGAVLSAYCSEVVRHGAESVLYPGEVNMIVYR